MVLFKGNVRDVCFTWWGNAGKFPEPREWWGLLDKRAVRYVTFQEERAPGTGELHWQGYAEFKRTMRAKGVLGVLEMPGVHIERRGGTREEAIAYCRPEYAGGGRKESKGKSGEGLRVWEFGKRAREGCRVGLGGGNLKDDESDSGCGTMSIGAEEMEDLEEEIGRVKGIERWMRKENCKHYTLLALMYDVSSDGITKSWMKSSPNKKLEYAREIAGCAGCVFEEYMTVNMKGGNSGRIGWAIKDGCVEVDFLKDDFGEETFFDEEPVFYERLKD